MKNNTAEKAKKCKNYAISDLYKTFVAFITLALLVEVAILVTTKAIGWDPSVSGRPWVVSAHVHIMVLGAFFTLMMILLDKTYAITKIKLFKPFFIVYLTGFSLILAFILYKGFSQLLGATVISGLLQAGAAMAHTTMFVSLFMFCFVLKDAIGLSKSKKAQPIEPQSIEPQSIEAQPIEPQSDEEN